MTTYLALLIALICLALAGGSTFVAAQLVKRDEPFYGFLTVALTAVLVSGTVTKALGMSA